MPGVSKCLTRAGPAGHVVSDGDRGCLRSVQGRPAAWVPHTNPGMEERPASSVMGAADSVNEKAPDRDSRDQRCSALRDRLWVGRQATFESLDKYVLTLSSGALALSLSLIRDVVPLVSAQWFPALVVSWTAFVGAIALTMASFVVGQLAHDKQLDILEKFQQGDDRAFDNEANPFVNWTKWPNYAAVGAFFIGLVATVAFVAINTSEARTVSEQDKQMTTREKKGIVPPNVPRPQPSFPPDRQKPPEPVQPSKQGRK